MTKQPLKLNVKRKKWCILSEEYVLKNVGEKNNNLFHNM